MTQRAVTLPTSYCVILAVSSTHLINDLIQFLLPALYPLLKSEYALSYFQLGLLTLAQQITACILQPVLGLYGDLRPKPYSLALSLAIVAIGVLLLATAGSFEGLLVASTVLGLGSALFHPEASRVCRMASGGRLGFAQSSFQVGGNTGTALGPLAAAIIVLPLGQFSTIWFGLLAVGGIIILLWVARWFTHHQRMMQAAGAPAATGPALPRKRLVIAFAVLGALLLSKFVYIETFKAYYVFFLIEKFGLDIPTHRACCLSFLPLLLLARFSAVPSGTVLAAKRSSGARLSARSPLPFCCRTPPCGRQYALA
ncbi:MFS transporter, FSR family, fosmidomycin resistance protein [Celeribacter marinus]|uniref:Fosmidomycin resistance protein n=1 Tax=Celeribacter marinus TaxID=1397108 RepID=A0A0N9ZSH5_9RHOB|nr:fosmidomycin resistance protein [Celeribacter marinus]SFK99569.1 MFS transporter, FSR family, fosmidomycin resistance protein [Celeribacter marinus]